MLCAGTVSSTCSPPTWCLSHAGAMCAGAATTCWSPGDLASSTRWLCFCLRWRSWKGVSWESGSGVRRLGLLGQWGKDPAARWQRQEAAGKSRGTPGALCATSQQLRWVWKQPRVSSEQLHVLVGHQGRGVYVGDVLHVVGQQQGLLGVLMTWQTPARMVRCLTAVVALGKLGRVSRGVLASSNLGRMVRGSRREAKEKLQLPLVSAKVVGAFMQ